MMGNLFTGTGYFFFSGVANFGDWAAVIHGLQPYWAWRVWADRAWALYLTTCPCCWWPPSSSPFVACPTDGPRIRRSVLDSLLHRRRSGGSRRPAESSRDCFTCSHRRCLLRWAQMPACLSLPSVMRRKNCRSRRSRRACSTAACHGSPRAVGRRCCSSLCWDAALTWSTLNLTG